MAKYDSDDEWDDEDDVGDVITLIDEDGSETDFRFLISVRIEDDEYVVMTKAGGDATEHFVFHLEDDGEGDEAYDDVLQTDPVFARVEAVARRHAAPDPACGDTPHDNTGGFSN